MQLALGSLVYGFYTLVHWYSLCGIVEEAVFRKLSISREKLQFSSIFKGDVLRNRYQKFEKIYKTRQTIIKGMLIDKTDFNKCMC